MNQKELLKLVKPGESNRLEFKKSTGQRTEAARTVCAMLNDAGGNVLFGVKDNGEITGQDVSARTQQDLATEFRRIDPPAHPDLEIISLDNGKQAIAVHVVTGDFRPYVYDGRPFVRIGPTTSLMPQAQYHLLLREREHAKHRWENEFVPRNITVADLDKREIRSTLSSAVAAGRLKRIPRQTIEDILQGFKLVKSGRLMNAAVALFGKSDRIRMLYPQLSIRLGRFKGSTRTAPVTDNRQFWGHAFELLRQAERFLMDHVPIAGHLFPGRMRREDRPAYPPLATREALANAICHRDYSSHGGAITLAMYDDHLEICNPDGFHLGITPKKLLQPHQSRPWNPYIADVFYRTELIEQFGMGTLNMLEWCKKNSNPPPRWEEQSGDVVVTFLPAAPFETVEAAASGLESRLESRLESQLESGKVPLAEKVLLALSTRELMKSEISERLGQKTISGQLHKVIRDLLSEKKIARTIPGKPQSRLQRYRLTLKGQALVKQNL